MKELDSSLSHERPADRVRPVRLRRLRHRANAPYGILAMIAAMAIGLAACSSGSVRSTAASGGSLTFGVDGTQVSINPAVAATAVTGLIDRNIFDSLVVQTGPDKFGPWLATKWTISDGGRVYTFQLRKGVIFQDGAPFNAEAVKENLDYVVNPTTKSAYASSLIAPYENSTVINDYTIEVKLKQAFEPFLQALSTPYLGIQSPSELTAPASSYEPVGTGPFSFVSWTPNQSVVLKRNPRYTSPPAGAAHTGPAHLDTLTFDFVSEDATRYGELTSGQVQGITDVPANDVKSLKNQNDIHVLTQITAGLNYDLYFNVRSGPLTNVLIRRALSASLNVPSLVKSVYFGVYPAVTNPIAPSTADYDSAAQDELTKYNPTLAKKLLAEAGYTKKDSAGYLTKDGKQLDIVWPYWAAGNKQDRNVLAEGIQAEANAVGIDLEHPTVDTGTYVNDLINGTYDVADVSFARPTPDVLRFAFESSSTYAHGGGNVALVNSQQINAWANGAAATTNGAVAERDYYDIQSQVLKEAYVLPLYNPVQIDAFSSSVKGIGYDEQAYPTFYDAWLAS
jgi:peptide/nickel transport system substrate-binding protein